jgi:hypothetical protein
MGSNILKFGMSKRYMGDQYNLPRNDKIKSLVDLASMEPSVKTVLDMPFSYYFIWVYPFSHSDAAWANGLSEKERSEEYKEVHALATYLLKKYSGSGKTFFLGHWEGDWHLRPNLDPKQDPAPKAITGMIDWLNVRQKAIDDAKLQTQSKDVYLYQYTEVNLVQIGMKNRKCLVNNVLPFSTVDYVSYSSYDTTLPFKGNTRKALHGALEYIESKLPLKPNILGKRVFIGEYGFPLDHAGTPQKQNEYSLDVCLTALEWGCPFVLYWEIYCNEKPGGKHKGFWLIDEKNIKQPFYYSLQAYYVNMKRFVELHKSEYRRLPTNGELNKKAVEIIRQAINECNADASSK